MPKVKALPKRKSRNITRLVVMNPSKGLNNIGSPLLIDNREFSDMLNMDFDETGVVRKRSGYTSVGDTLTAAKGLGTFTTESLNYVTTVDGTSLKYLNSGVWTAVSGASFSAGQEVCFTQARNKLYIWNGVDGGASWDGTTLTRPGTMPKAKFSVFYQNYQIASGVAGQPNRLYISQTDDSSAFTRAATLLNNATEVPGATVFTGTTANYIDVRPNDGDFITGVVSFQDVVLVFKNNSCYELTFDASATPQPVITPISNSIGCRSHKSIAQVENDVLFLAGDGVRKIGNDPGYISSTGSTIRTHVISYRINPSLTAINPLYASKANAIYYNTSYILGFPTTTSSVVADVVYDNRFDAWTRWDTINPNAMVAYTDSLKAKHLYFLSDTGTRMYEIVAGTYNDNGAAINSYIISKAQDFGNPDLTKRFVDCTMLFRTIAGQVTITLYTDNETQAGSATIGQVAADGMGLSPLATRPFATGTAVSSTTINSDIAERVVIGQNSRTLKFKVSNARLNENFTFLGYTMGYYPSSHFLFDSQYKIYT
jgi:hypothetical protein